MAWQVVWTKNIDGNNVAVEVSKNTFKGKGHYSLRFGRIKDGKVSLFLDPDKLNSDALLSGMFDAQDFIATDRANDARAEAERLAALAGHGRNKNPQANTGLSRFKKKPRTAEQIATDADTVLTKQGL